MLYIKTGYVPDEALEAGVHGARADQGDDTIILLDEALTLREQSDLAAVLLAQPPTVSLARAG